MLINNAVITGSLTVNGTNISYITGSVPSSSFAQTASYVLPLSQSVIVSGSLTITGSVSMTGSLNVNNSLIVTGSVTATSALARSTNIAPTLVAAANSDVLVGLDINPTFTAGAFTGVSNVALRINSGFTYLGGTLRVSGTTANPTGAGGFFVFDGSEMSNFAYDYGASAYRSLAYNGSYVRFLTGGTERARFSVTNGNFLINTTTDSGFRLDVNGTSRFQDDMTFTNTKGLILQTSGTNRASSIKPIDITDNFAGVGFYPSSGTNVGQAFIVSPKGTGYSNSIKAQFTIHGLDYYADAINFEAFICRATGTSFNLMTGKGGTGTIRPILISSGFIDGTTNPNQLWVYSSGNIGINTTTDAGFRLDVNGTARITNNLTVSGSTVMTGSLTVNGSSVVLSNQTSSYATTGSNTFTNIQYISSSTNAAGFTTSASLYTDGGARIAKDLFVSGTTYLTNLTVYGTASVQYITSSQINVGANIIYLNTQTPAVRYGGMAVADSGSNPGVTGSMLWDSVNNGWIYTRESGSNYSSGALISGPKSSVQGSEQSTIANYIMKGQGGDHITGSQIYDDGTTVQIPGNLQVTGSLSGSSAVFSSTVNATNGLLIGNGGATATSGYVPKFTGTSTIGNSQVFDNGTNVGINQPSPTRTLDILGASGIGTVLKLQGASGTTTYLQMAYNGATNAQSGYIGYNSSSQMQLFTANTLRATLDASGNLGLGVTPSAWTSWKALQINGNAVLAGYVNNTILGNNWYYDGTDRYTSNGFANIYQQGGGIHAWYNAPSGTAGNAITFTQAMTLTASGRLLIGTPTEATYLLDVNGTGRFSDTISIIANNSTAYSLNLLGRSADNATTLNFFSNNGATRYGFIYTEPTTMIFGVNGATRLTIASTGAATFSSSVTAGGNIQTDGTANKYIKSTGFISNQTGQLTDFGAADSGFFIVSGGTMNFVATGATRLSIASTGAATFSSNITLSGSGTTGLDLASSTFSYCIDLPNNQFIRQKNASNTLGLLLGMSSDNNTYLRGFSGLALQVNNGTSALTLASTGAATFSSGIGIGSATATTGGIQFPATAVAIADANNLDDYEEGTWTPTLTTSGGTPPTVVSSSGRYIIIGKLVTIYFKFLLSSASGGSGQLKITNAPFSLNLSTIPAVGFARITDLGLTLNCGFLTGTVINFNKYDGNYAGTDYETVGQVSYYND